MESLVEWIRADRSLDLDPVIAVVAVHYRFETLHPFARGIQEAASSTRHQMVRLVGVQEELKQIIRESTLRADTAHALVDHAVANPSFTVRSVEAALGVSDGRANKAVEQLTEIGVLASLGHRSYKRRFYAPRVLDILLRTA